MARQSFRTKENTIECEVLPELWGKQIKQKRQEGGGRVRGAGARLLQRCLGFPLNPSVGGKTIAPLGPKAQGCLPEIKVPDEAYSTECAIQLIEVDNRKTQNQQKT